MTWRDVGRALGIGDDAARCRYRRAKAAQVRGEGIDPGVSQALAGLRFDSAAAVSGGWLKGKISDDLDASIQFRLPAIDEVKTTAEEAVEIFREALAGFADPVAPLEEPEIVARDLMSELFLPDLHFGMYASGLEVGEAYDTELARERVIGMARRVIAKAPPSELFVISILGDTLHANDRRGVTPHSGHHLDMAGRHFEIALACVQVILEIIELARAKFARVVVRGVGGNHDPDAADWLSIALLMRLEKEERVEIEPRGGKWSALEFGGVMSAIYHGDKVPFARAAGFLADEFSQMFGRTKWRFAHSGHIHHERAEFIGGFYMRALDAICPRDSYGHGSGFTSRSSLRIATYHKDGGPPDVQSAGVINGRIVG